MKILNLHHFISLSLLVIPVTGYAMSTQIASVLNVVENAVAAVATEAELVPIPAAEMSVKSVAISPLDAVADIAAVKAAKLVAANQLVAVEVVEAAKSNAALVKAMAVSDLAKANFVLEEAIKVNKFSKFKVL